MSEIRCGHCGGRTIFVKHFYGDARYPRGGTICITFGSNCEQVQKERGNPPVDKYLAIVAAALASK